MSVLVRVLQTNRINWIYIYIYIYTHTHTYIYTHTHIYTETETKRFIIVTLVIMKSNESKICNGAGRLKTPGSKQYR